MIDRIIERLRWWLCAHDYEERKRHWPADGRTQVFLVCKKCGRLRVDEL